MREVAGVLRLYLQRGGAVRDDVNLMRRLGAWGQIDGAEVRASDHRRIDKRFQGHRRKLQAGRRLMGQREGGAELPSIRQAERGGIAQFAGLGAFWIERQKVPAQANQLSRGGGSR